MVGRSRAFWTHFYPQAQAAFPEALRGVLRDGDVILTMGAGNIGAVAQDLKARLATGAAA